MDADSPGFPTSFRPSPEEVRNLLRRAEQHPLGLPFLRNGDQGAVAATFRVHAFTVDAARWQLANGNPEPAGARSR